MARFTLMHRLARWHIWLGWLIAIPLLLWTASGLVMVLRPIEEVRGTSLRIEPPVRPVEVALNGSDQATLIREGHIMNQRGRSILLVTYMDGSVARIDLKAGGATHLPPVDEAEARRAVAAEVVGGKAVQGAVLFDAAHSPPDFRRKQAAWQVTLADGTRVYVGRDTGQIEAVRTPWWRFYDFMWGLHIMDPIEREDTSHPLLMASALASLAGVVIGAILLFRKRRAPKR